MHKGLKSTLITVAVALLGLKAMAMAPTINQLPDVIIGDEQGASGGATLGASIANNFVYPDAFNVDNFADDDNTTDGALRWSFMNPGNHYSINARTRLDGSAENPENPSAAYSLDGGDDPNAVDSNRRTLTFRNIQFSPLPLQASYPDPGTPVGVPSDGQAITLIASDGTSHTQSSPFMAYIVNDGVDALSGAGVGTELPDIDLTVATGWVYHEDLQIGGTVSHAGPSSPNGLCVSVSAAGVNIIGWDSQGDYIVNGQAGTPYNTVTLADNAVYRARVSATTTAQPGLVPAWEFIYDNTVTAYGGAFIFFDSGVNPNAGANTPPSAGTRSEFHAYMNAPAMSNAAFKTQVFNTPANAPLKNMRLKLRVLDVDGANYGAESDAGTVCWNRIKLTQFNIANMSVQSTPYNNTNMVQATNTASGVANTQAGALHVDDFSGSGNSNVSFAGGALSILPTAAGASTWNTTSGNGVFFQVVPGDGTITVGTPDMQDNYPVPWVTDQLYRIVFTMVAPDAASENGPPDFYFIGGDVITNDLISRVYGTTKLGLAGMPKQGTPQEFFSFWHGNSTATQGAVYQFLRPFLSFGTNGSFIDAPNTGGLKITGIRVEKVTF